MPLLLERKWEGTEKGVDSWPQGLCHNGGDGDPVARTHAALTVPRTQGPERELIWCHNGGDPQLGYHDAGNDKEERQRERERDFIRIGVGRTGGLGQAMREDEEGWGAREREADFGSGVKGSSGKAGGTGGGTGGGREKGAMRKKSALEPGMLWVWVWVWVCVCVCVCVCVSECVSV